MERFVCLVLFHWAVAIVLLLSALILLYPQYLSMISFERHGTQNSSSHTEELSRKNMRGNAVLNQYFQGYSYPTSSPNYMFARTGYVTRGRKRSFLSPSQLGGDSNRVIYMVIRYLIITSNELCSM